MFIVISDTNIKAINLIDDGSSCVTLGTKNTKNEKIIF
jgi:hypothetical protein